jgi:predicted O-methyltransferase YrrM
MRMAGIPRRPSPEALGIQDDDGPLARVAHRRRFTRMDATWTNVDDYFASQLTPADDVLTAALADSAAAGLRPISVTAPQGKLLHLFARMIHARRILEIGTLGGYSTIWLARALPADGKLVTLEIDPAAAAVARRNLARAGLADRVELMLAPASESLRELAADGAEPFDLVFIDADKASSDRYFLAALDLCRVGSIIVVDNVVRDGAVADAESTDPDILGIRRLIDLLPRERRVEATAVQTVGSKGYDGFLLARVASTARSG